MTDAAGVDGVDTGHALVPDGARVQRGGHRANTPTRFAARYLTQQAPTGKSAGLPRYYWSPSGPLVRQGFKPVRIPGDWAVHKDGDSLLAGAVEAANQLNERMDRALALKKVVALGQGANPAVQSALQDSLVDGLRANLEDTQSMLAQSRQELASCQKQLALAQGELAESRLTMTRMKAVIDKYRAMMQGAADELNQVQPGRKR